MPVVNLLYEMFEGTRAEKQLQTLLKVVQRSKSNFYHKLLNRNIVGYSSAMQLIHSIQKSSSFGTLSIIPEPLH